MPADAVMLNRRIINASLTMMGSDAQRALGVPMNSIIAGMGPHAESADGRRLSEVLRTEGWPAYKALRDEPFTPGWLED
jgi:hypothetical protein